MLTPILNKLMEQRELTDSEIAVAVAALVDDIDSCQAAAFLTLLHAKGETAGELAAFVKEMKQRALLVGKPCPVLDIVGTGGDGAGTINISTAAALLAASCGATVAKHGNRAASSKCGGADVLEALGVKIDLSAEAVERCLESVGIGFIFARSFHPAFKNIAPIRQRLKVKTIFNLMGPLLNPAGADYGVFGVFDPALVSLYADVLQRQGITKAVVFHCCGTDELTPVGVAEGIIVTADEQRPVQINPQKQGFAPCTIEQLQGGDPSCNAQHLREIFAGRQGPMSDAVVLNAGVALAICGVASSFEEGIAIASDKQRSGAVASLLERLVQESHNILEINK